MIYFYVIAVPGTFIRHSGLDPASRKPQKCIDSGSSPE